MRIGRAILMAVILALGVAGSVITGSAMSVAAGHVASVHVQTSTASASPHMLYHD
jgi:hypothetical protein